MNVQQKVDLMSICSTRLNRRRCFQPWKHLLFSCSTEVGQTLLWSNNNESLNLTSLCTCSRWLLSAYPLTNSQYRVVDRLGPGRSSMLFSFPAAVAAWTFSLLPPCRSSGSVRRQSAASRGARDEAAGEPMVRAVWRWMFWGVRVCVCVCHSLVGHGATSPE